MIETAYLSTDKIVCEIEESFIDHFHEIPGIVSAPGRINFIGEHTDYNMGFVLPSAINQAIFIALAPNHTNKVSYVSLDMNETYEADIHSLKKSEKSWPNYLNGVMEQLLKKGLPVSGFNCVIKGNIPMCAGMSSSAALECATIFGLNEIFDLKLDKLTMIDLAQKAENEFVGVKCGNLDFFAIMFAKRNYAIQLDCRSLEYKYVHIRMDDYHIVLFDTNVNRTSASSEYNMRTEACLKATAMINKVHPSIKSLRDTSIAILDEVILPEGEELYWLCRYVVEENQRLLDACADLASGNLKAFGKKMFLTHDGLSQHYKVSCPELDYLVDFVRNDNAVIGARLMGAGFGGCTINLVKKEALKDLIPRITHAYEKDMKRTLKVYVCETAGGVALIQ